MLGHTLNVVQRCGCHGILERGYDDNLDGAYCVLAKKKKKKKKKLLLTTITRSGLTWGGCGHESSVTVCVLTSCKSIWADLELIFNPNLLFLSLSLLVCHAQILEITAN